MTLLEIVKNAILKVYSDKPIVGQLCLCQAVLESNLLHHPSALAMKYNNLFGIKGSGTAGSINLKTHEYIKGVNTVVMAPFAYNKSMDDSIAQHRALMQHTRYKAVWEATSFDDAADAVFDAGYATDPHYVDELDSVYDEVIGDE